MTEWIICTETNKDKDPIHIFLQRLDEGLVVTLSFFRVKRPEGVGTSMKIAYHARILTRIIGDGASFARLSTAAYHHYGSLGVYILGIYSSTCCA